MSEGRWISPLSVGGSWVGFRSLLTEDWAGKKRLKNDTPWESCTHNIFQKACFSGWWVWKTHVSALLSSRLLDVIGRFLLMHQNLWIALSTWGSGPNAWRSSLGSSGPPMLLFKKAFMVKKSHLLWSHPFMLSLVLKHDLISKLSCSWGKVWLGHSEAFLGFAVPVILGSGPEDLLGFQQKYCEPSFTNLLCVKHIGK